MKSIKNCDNKNYIRVYINLYVHYPESFFGTIINDKLLEYFKMCFKEINLIIESDVKVNSIPHVEEELVELEVNFDSQLDKKINIEVILENWK